MTPTVMRLAFGMSTAVKSMPGIAQAEQKHRIAAQAIEAADDELRPVAAAGFERSREAGAVAMALAALDLDDFLDELPRAAVEPSLDRGALRLEARGRSRPAWPSKPANS